MTDLLQMLGLSLFGGVLGLTGGLVLLYNKKWSVILEKNAIPYAAGVLITVSILGLLPEAVEFLDETAYWLVLLSFFAAFFIEKLLVSLHHHGGEHHHHHEDDEISEKKATIWFVLLGDTIHNFIDGAAIGASFLINPGLGALTAFSTFLHEVPHEIGDFGVLLRAGWAKKNIIIANIVSALITVVGTFSVLFFAENEQLLGGLMAVSAGVFLYLGAIDFLPHVVTAKSSKRSSLLPLLLGIITMMVTIYFTPHTH